MSWTICPYSGKHGFVTREEAERQLRKARTIARRMRRQGKKAIRRQERRVYGPGDPDPCPCGRYHLTSMTEYEVLSRRGAQRRGAAA